MFLLNDDSFDLRPFLVRKNRYIINLLMVITFRICTDQKCVAQDGKVRNFKSDFQASLFPGISTNGIQSGLFTNKISINIFGGLSAGNELIEFGGISNINLKSSSGVQVAGLANIIGANTFINLTSAEERALIQNDFKVNSNWILLASILNFVLNDATGIQFSGAANY